VTIGNKVLPSPAIWPWCDQPESVEPEAAERPLTRRIDLTSTSAWRVSPLEVHMSAQAIKTKPDAPPDGGGAETNGHKKSRWWVRPVIVAAAIAAIAVGLWITMANTEDAILFSSTVTNPVGSLTIFSVFFVVAAAIERLMEPFAGLLPDKADLNKKAEDDKSAAESARAEAETAGSDEDKEKKKKEAQKKDADAEGSTDLVFGETIGFWALATILGFVASAMLKLYLPYAVGITTGGRAIQILATGLIIGGGTKPLHDLVGYMTAAKDAKEGDSK
jgi:hypothetical protein